MSNDIPKETEFWRQEKKFMLARQEPDFQSRNIKYEGTPRQKKGNTKESNL